MGIDPQNVVDIGAAENIHSFVEACGFGIEVRNAIPSLKDRVHHVTPSARGAGIAELIGHLLAGDLDALVASHAIEQSRRD